MEMSTLREMRRHRLYATDGLVGPVKDFLFDDKEWIVRYMIADTGPWLRSQVVLISPQSVRYVDLDDGSLRVSLSRRQVEDSPPISADMSISRQIEEQLVRHYEWTAYWMGEVTGGGIPPSTTDGAKDHATASSRINGNPNLRSSREVVGYGIEAPDGEIGHVHDFMVDIDSWAVVQMVVDTRNWLPGKKVLIAPNLISDIRWSDKRVLITPERRVVCDGPEFDPSRPIS